jgi:pimeloyl-ACP methyl ester carboxylesterase
MAQRARQRQQFLPLSAITTPTKRFPMMRLIRLLSLSLLLAFASPGFAWRVWDYQGEPVAYRLDGVGPPVVQIHGIGAGASSEQTKYQIDTLTAAGYRVYSLDLTGWGESIGPKRLFTGAYYADLVAAFLQQVVAEPAALIGHSLGATYAIAAAAAIPDQVTALILNSPVGAESFTDEPTPQSEWFWEFLVTSRVGQGFYRALGSWLSLASFCRNSLYVDPSFCTLETLYDYRQYTRLPDSIYGAAAFLTNNLGLNVRKDFAVLRQPILLIWGAQSAFTPLSEAHAFRRLNRRAELVVVEHAGALVNDEQRDLFNQLVLDHLAGVEHR